MLHILATSLAILAAEWLIGGVIFQYDFVALMKLALLMGVINFFLKPILKMIAAPVILLTLGLFTFVINTFLVWLVVYIAPTFNVQFTIQGLNAFIWTMLIVTAFNLIVSIAIKEARTS